jgi:hypothetical protein
MLNKFAFIGFLGIVVFLSRCSSNNTVEEKITPLTKSWEIIVPNQYPPQGLTSLSAEYCGQCHQSHYEDWKKSTHAHAWTDEQFQSEIKKEQNPFFCINCHVPLQNQQEFFIDGLIDGDIYKPSRRENPSFDKKLQSEGITCAACHVREGYIIGASGKKGNTVHPVRYDPEFLSEKLCISCHNASATIKDDLVCTFETGDEWKKGKYYKEKNCISCHMPESDGEIMVGIPGKKHLHSFPGSGIAKHSDYTADHMADIGVDFSLNKKMISTNEKLQVIVELKNEHAGHQVPTGDPERYFIVSLKVKDKQNKTIFTKEERIGETWTWSPKAKKLSDNNLKVGEVRMLNFETENLPKGAYKVGLHVEKFRMSRENADYHKLSDKYPISRVIYTKEKSFLVK